MSDDRFGVDRVSISFPVRSWERDVGAWAGGINHRPGTDPTVTHSGSVKLDQVDVFVGVREGGGVPVSWGKVEFNPARVVDPDGVGLCPVVELVPIIARALEAAGEVLEVATEVGDMRVKRLDVARDFEDVEAPGFYVRGLLQVKRKWARYASVYNDPVRGCAETLRVGSGSGMVRLYDKHQESPGKAAPGHLRWEAECRSGWTDRYGNIRTVQDLTTTNIGQLASDRWEWSSMGVEVAATDRVIEKILRAGHRDDCPKGCQEHLSAAEQRGFYGYMVFTARGWETPTSSSTQAKYAKIARELSVSLSAEELRSSVSSEGFTGRLDWDSGRELLQVA